MSPEAMANGTLNRHQIELRVGIRHPLLVPTMRNMRNRRQVPRDTRSAVSRRSLPRARARTCTPIGAINSQSPEGAAPIQRYGASLQCDRSRSAESKLKADSASYGLGKTIEARFTRPRAQVPCLKP